MIALVVMAILAAVALPAYHSHIQKGRRASAFTAVSAVQQAQERYRSNSSAYADNFGALFAGESSSPEGRFNTSDGHYALALSGVSAVGYSIEARPVSGDVQAGDTKCAVMSMTMRGGNASYTAATGSGGVNAECWPK